MDSQLLGSSASLAFLVVDCRRGLVSLARKLHSLRRGPASSDSSRPRLSVGSRSECVLSGALVGGAPSEEVLDGRVREP
eukprot:310532-Pyramimonas_sp.AAC.1